MNKNIFIYKGSKQAHKSYEILCNKIVEIVTNMYVLPKQIEFQFENMGQNVYGMTMLDPRFPNRIRLNQDLSIEELPIPLTHELSHLHQIYTNKLQARSGGRILWEGQMYKVDAFNLSYNDYLNLPWEDDANKKQKRILEFIQQNSKKIKARIDKEIKTTQNTIQS